MQASSVQWCRWRPQPIGVGGSLSWFVFLLWMHEHISRPLTWVEGFFGNHSNLSQQLVHHPCSWYVLITTAPVEPCYHPGWWPLPRWTGAWRFHSITHFDVFVQLCDFSETHYARWINVWQPVPVSLWMLRVRGSICGTGKPAQIARRRKNKINTSLLQMVQVTDLNDPYGVQVLVMTQIPNGLLHEPWKNLLAARIFPASCWWQMVSWPWAPNTRNWDRNPHWNFPYGMLGL